MKISDKEKGINHNLYGWTEEDQNEYYDYLATQEQEPEEETDYVLEMIQKNEQAQIEWEKLSEADKMIYYTFAPGKDFFVKGDKSDVLITDDFYQYMKENCDSVYKVTTVDHYSDVMKHMEVGGK